MHIRVVLQARMSSARLPAKVLLPISGIPMAILCAKRISRDGLDLILATSDQQSDDLLVYEAEKNGIQVVRGSLNNVLSRYAESIQDLADDDLVVRVTADNPVVDADFVHSLTKLFRKSNLDCLGTQSPLDYLPYGLSAEVMTAKSIRKAYSNTNGQYDLEHVTPWIRKNLKFNTVDGKVLTGNKDLSYLRCTVDSFDDYENVSKLFNVQGVDAVDSSWELIVENLIKQDDSPQFSVPFSSKRGTANSLIALGTVQLGLNYGIANKSGIPDSEAAINIVREAIKHGVNWIDTARGYGVSEQRVGFALDGGWASRTRIVTKLDPLGEINGLSSNECIKFAVESSVYKSMHFLQQNSLDVLLLHRWEHRNICQGKIWEILIELKANGLIKELGVSVYSVSEAMDALSDSEISHLQLPFNLLDHRWLNKDFQAALKNRQDVRIHIRSAFLQGLLISDSDVWPKWDKDADKRVQDIDELVLKFGRKNRADLCMSFILACNWIDSIVIGVETNDQLEDNFGLICEKPLTDKECEIVIKKLSGAPERLVNPSQW